MRTRSPVSLRTAHGGANEAALKMLEEISTVEHIPEFVRRAKDKMTPSV